MNLEDFVRIVVFISIFTGLFTMAFYLLPFLEKKPKKKQITKYPFASIIIPAYNEEDCLEKTVNSVLSLNYPKDKYEIIIVDDGSKDRTLEIAKRLARKNSLIRVLEKKNGGKASAMNLGIKASKGELVISFDSDSMVTPNALIEMLPYFDDPKVVCVTPVMKVYKPKGILQRVQAIEYDLGIFLRKAFSNIDSIHVTPGPFSVYKKWFFEKHGGYDEKNITEDMEVAMRIQSLNYKIENSIKSVVFTIAPKKLNALTRQRRRWYFGMIRNLWKYKQMFSKQYGELGTIILPLAIFSVFTTMIVTFYYLIKGFFDGVKNLIFYSTIGFDFITNSQMRWYLWTADLYRTFSESIILFAILFFLLSVFILIYTNRKIGYGDAPVSIFINYVFFMFLYSIMFSIWWVISIVYSITHKEIEW